MYKVIFTYFDDVKFAVHVDDNELDNMVLALGKNAPFMNASKSRGFWIQGEKIRHFVMERVQSDKQHSEASRIEEEQRQGAISIPASSD